MVLDLLLGNVTFEPKAGSPDEAAVADEGLLQSAAAQLGCPESGLKAALVERSFAAEGAMQMLKRTPAEATEARDGLLHTVTYRYIPLYLRYLLLHTVTGARRAAQAPLRAHIPLARTPCARQPNPALRRRRSPRLAECA